jgi:hypothetical protein
VVGGRAQRDRGPTVRPLAGIARSDSSGRATGDGRTIDRHNYTRAEVSAALRRPVVKRLLELVRLRNSHPAFDGSLGVETDGQHSLRLR